MHIRCICINICIRIRTYLPAYLHTYLSTTYMHANIHEKMYIYVHTRTYRHIYGPVWFWFYSSICRICRISVPLAGWQTQYFIGPGSQVPGQKLRGWKKHMPFSMILTTYPGKIPQTSPNKHKERNFFRFQGPFGIFQGGPCTFDLELYHWKGRFFGHRSRETASQVLLLTRQLTRSQWSLEKAASCPTGTEWVL